LREASLGFRVIRTSARCCRSFSVANRYDEEHGRARVILRGLADRLALDLGLGWANRRYCGALSEQQIRCIRGFSNGSVMLPVEAPDTFRRAPYSGFEPIFLLAAAM
jgi:hypothetical protein